MLSEIRKQNERVLLLLAVVVMQYGVARYLQQYPKKAEVVRS
jgi:hypothetical protein